MANVQRQLDTDPAVGPARPRATAIFFVVLGALIALAYVAHEMAVVAVVGALAAMIFLHEAGHFLMAKWGRMKVTDFFLGFGPKLWSFRRGETEYGIKAIPAGGFVRIVGMNSLEKVDPQDEARSYRAAPFWRRITVGVAGSAVHFILAFVMLWSLLVFYGLPSNQLAVGGFTTFTGSPNPAVSAGMKVGDKLVSVDGVGRGNPAAILAQIRSHPGTPVRIVVDRSGKVLHLTATPLARYGSPVSPSGSPTATSGRPFGLLGIEVHQAVARSSPLDAVPQSGSALGRMVGTYLGGLGHLFSPSGLSAIVHQAAAPPNPAPRAGSSSSGPQLLGVVGIARLTVQAANAGVPQLLAWLTFINVALGTVNMLPLPPLDGGHVVVAIYERLRSQKGRSYRADAARLLPVAYAMFALIVVLEVTALYLNVAHPAPNPFN